MIIRVKDYVHLATFAPAGAGKGVSAVLPNLKAYPRSVVVADVKGENFNLTSQFRCKKFVGHRTIRLDPFAVCGPGGGGLNPFDFLDPDAPDLLDSCRDLANMLVVRTGFENDPYWNDRAEQVLTSFIYFVAACESNPARRHLLSVRALVSSRDAYLATVNVMRQMTGVVKQQGDSLTWLADKELNSVLSVVQRHTAWMDSPVVADCLRESSFDPRELRGGRTSVYLVLPPERLVTLAPLMRMWLGTIIRVLSRGEASEKNPVLFLIDEAAHLGKMQVLEDAVTLMRGYGIRLWLFFQSIGQVQKVYGDNAQTILDNLGTQQYFGMSNSFDSADAISKRIGDMTITQRSVNDTSGHSHPTGQSAQPQPGNASTSLSVTTSETGRRWAKAEEIMTLPADMALVFHKNLPVIPAKLVRHSPLFKHGRTGESRGPGLAAGVMATTMLVASLLLSAVTASLPDPPPSRPAVAVPAVRQAPPPRFVDGRARQGGPSRPPATLRNRQSQRRSSRSGYLIRIP